MGGAIDNFIAILYNDKNFVKERRDRNGNDRCRNFDGMLA